MKVATISQQQGMQAKVISVTIEKRAFFSVKLWVQHGVRTTGADNQEGGGKNDQLKTAVFTLSFRPKVCQESCRIGACVRDDGGVGFVPRCRFYGRRHFLAA